MSARVERAGADLPPVPTPDDDGKRSPSSLTYESKIQANGRIRSLQSEFWRLHAKEGNYSDPANSVLDFLRKREPSVEISALQKQDVVGFMNLGFAGCTATRHAGILPLSRLGQTPAVAVQASPNWITEGYHKPNHNPSFRAFTAQRVAADTHCELESESLADETT